MLAQATWPELAGHPDAVLLIPVGATEQHGPHLPLSTDTDLALAVATAVACERDGVFVAPPVSYGSSGEHAGFAGTLSIGQAATELLLVELCRSASATFRRVMLISTHGGNVEPVRRALALLREEGRDVRVFVPQWSADAHAGRAETSLMLTVAPDSVRPDLAQVGNTQPLRELIGALREHGVLALSPNGVLGDPHGASADEGDAMLQSAVDVLAAQLDGWP